MHRALDVSFIENVKFLSCCLHSRKGSALWL